MDNISSFQNYDNLDTADRQLIREIIKRMQITMSFGVCLASCFASIFLIGLVGYMQDPGSTMFFLLLFGVGMSVLAFLIARQVWREWKRKTKPLRDILHRSGQKIVYKGRLHRVSKLENGGLLYELGDIRLPVEVILSAEGWASFPKVIYKIDVLTDVSVSLHIIAMPDGRKLLLKAVYAAEQQVHPTFRTTIKEKSTRRMLIYFLLTIGYVALLMVNLSGIFPLGILLGVFPTTLLYIFALFIVNKRSKCSKQTIQIVGRVTEIIAVPTRIRVMGEPSSSYQDTWFRVNGKAYPIISNNPPKGISVGDGIELTVVRN